MYYTLNPDIPAAEFAEQLRKVGLRIVNKPGGGAEIRRVFRPVAVKVAPAHQAAFGGAMQSGSSGGDAAA